jgi:hypothetical protein
MTAEQVNLCERLKRLGFSHGNHMNLYGQHFEVRGEPLVIADNVVLFDAINRKSGESCRVRIPVTILHMANAEVRVAA